MTSCSRLLNSPHSVRRVPVLPFFFHFPCCTSAPHRTGRTFRTFSLQATKVPSRKGFPATKKLAYLFLAVRMIGTARIADLHRSNGVVHVLDTVLVPGWLSSERKPRRSGGKRLFGSSAWAIVRRSKRPTAVNGEEDVRTDSRASTVTLPRPSGLHSSTPVEQKIPRTSTKLLSRTFPCKQRNLLILKVITPLSGIFWPFGSIRALLRFPVQIELEETRCDFGLHCV